MSNQPDTEYERVKIEATLCCESDLHIGSGIDIKIPRKDRSGKKPMETCADICLDKDDNPYIPASTLRGYIAKTLRGILKNAESDALPIMNSLLNSLLGAAHQKSSDSADDNTKRDEHAETDDNTKRDEHAENSDTGMGKLRVYDARYKASDNESDSDKSISRCIPRTAIEPITGTSSDHQLFTCKVVTAGARFALAIELDNVSTAHIQLLVDALAYLNGSETAQLGKNKSLMSGRLSISDIEIKALSTREFKKWLLSDELMDEKFKPPTDIDKDKDKDKDKGKMSNLSEFRTLALSIFPDAPLLVNDVHLVEDEPETPNHVFTRRGKKLCIPASTLKGLIRGHCRKILLTLLHNEDGPKQAYSDHQAMADKMLLEIFGGEKAAGLLRVSDALSVGNALSHVQSFIAVDRFTGGVAKGALYSAEAAVADELPCTLYLHQRLLENDWMTGLLWLVLRDAMEADLSIGWGKSRGFGAFKLGIMGDKAGDTAGDTRMRSWLEVLDWQGAERIGAKVEELQLHIMLLIEQIEARETA